MSKPSKVTNHFAFIYTDKPASYNADSRKKSIFKDKLSSTYNRYYKGLISNEDLAAIIYYFYQDDLHLDADNLSKPTWDALIGTAFTDDNQIKIRSAISIDINKHGTLDFNYDDLPDKLLKELMNSILRNKHTLLISVCSIKQYDKIFKIQSLWK